MVSLPHMCEATSDASHSKGSESKREKLLEMLLYEEAEEAFRYEARGRRLEHYTCQVHVMKTTISVA